MSISNPDALDRGFWKCLLGVSEEHSGVENTVGAVIDGNENTDDATQNDIHADDVYGLQDAQVNILCKSNFVIGYCWFRHPNGQKISVSDVTTASDGSSGNIDAYRYFGSGIKLGECGLSIMKASVDDSGSWSCHMGPTETAGVESTKTISVRVSGKQITQRSSF